MKKGILIAFGELFLKSENVKKLFQKRLVFNLSSFLKKEEIDFKIKSFRERIFIETEDIDKASEVVGRCFGIVWHSPVFYFSDASLEEFSDFVFKQDIKGSFAIRLKMEKGLLKEKKEEVIDKIAGKIDNKVDLDNPDTEIFVEIRKKGWFLYFEKRKGLGGLPAGASGKGLSLVSGEIDSPVASFLAAKRGVENIWLHFHSFPLVSKKSIEKIKELAEVFLKYQPSLKVYFVPFQKAQLEVKAKIPAKYRVLSYRRLMLKIAERIAEKEKCLALITGESLGQVSSQTLVNMGIVSDAADIPIIRPLVGKDKNEIIDKAKKIGTYNISIKPQEDCCTLFVPAHQTAKGDLKKLEEMEKKINTGKIVEEALKEAEIENY